MLVGKKIKVAIIIAGLLFVIIILANFMRLHLIARFDGYVKRGIKETALLDSDGEIFYVVGGYNNRESLSNINDVSITIRHAVMALEDTRFYRHVGIDPIRMGGALLHALKFKGYLEGASTLTQQLIKNTVLNRERSLVRKIKEIFYAVSIETSMDKDALFLMYLNTAYYGNGYYGIEKASKGYFGKSAVHITHTEACMLAALIKKPEGYNPFKNGLQGLTQRQKYCLYRLYRLGNVSRAQYNRLKNKPINIGKKPLDQSNFHEFYAMWVIRQIKKKLGADFLKPDGLRIYTPMNRRVQKTIERAVQRQFKNLHKKKDIAVILLDHKNGQVLAMTGGRNFRVSQFNKATQARRQLGSSFKPFVYAAALEAGYSQKDTFVDEPTEYYSEDRYDENGFPELYVPENYNLDYAGTMSLHDALIYSNNVISVKLLNEMKPPALFRLTDKMHMPINKEKGLCIALGCSELTPEELTAGYQIFSNGGGYFTPHYILKIVDTDENILYEHTQSEPIRVISGDTSRQMNRILKDAVLDGTAKAANPRIVVAGGKTGTTDNYRDAWFVGFTHDYTAGVWIGREDNTPTNGDVGGGLPAIVWREFTQELYAR